MTENQDPALGANPYRSPQIAGSTQVQPANAAPSHERVPGLPARLGLQFLAAASLLMALGFAWHEGSQWAANAGPVRDSIFGVGIGLGFAILALGWFWISVRTKHYGWLRSGIGLVPLAMAAAFLAAELDALYFNVQKNAEIGYALIGLFFGLGAVLVWSGARKRR